LLNLRRTSILFPGHEIFFITNVNLNKTSINNVNIVRYTPNSDWHILNKNLKHSKTFRNNFWLTSTARFLALEYLSRQIGEILHIESDVIISEDFPFTKFTNSKFDFLFPVVSKTNAIASCLYLKDSNSAKLLAQKTLEESKRNNYTTDMYILSELSRNREVNFAPLPTAPSKYYDKAINDESFLKKSDQSLLYFGGVFDGFDLGRYLFGDDPRNKRGIKILRDNDPRTYLNVRSLNLISKPGRDFPFISESELNQEWPIYSLHIHSKNSNLFRFYKSQAIINKALKESKLTSKKVFVFSVFLSSLFGALKRRIIKLAGI
jgi:hypothetical protein